MLSLVNHQSLPLNVGSVSSVGQHLFAPPNVSAQLNSNYKLPIIENEVYEHDNKTQDLLKLILGIKRRIRRSNEGLNGFDGGNLNDNLEQVNNNANAIPEQQYHHFNNFRSYQHKNKKPVYVSINQQSVNGLLSLLLLFIVSICGCMGSIFIISALTVIESLQTRGNCYLVSLALAHLLVTLLVLPSSGLQIMAGEGINGRLLCHYQWLTLEFSLIVSQLSFFLIATDNYLGFKCSQKVTTSGECALRVVKQFELNQHHACAFVNEQALQMSANPMSPEREAALKRRQQWPPLMSKQFPANSATGAPQGQWPPRLAQNSGSPGSSCERRNVASCLSYRNCCGRLKVLVWILIVWTAAFAYTIHQHGASYGAKFCSAPVKQNASLPQARQNLSPKRFQSRPADEANGGGEEIAAGRFGRSVQEEQSEMKQLNIFDASRSSGIPLGLFPTKSGPAGATERAQFSPTSARKRAISPERDSDGSSVALNSNTRGIFKLFNGGGGEAKNGTADYGKKLSLHDKGRPNETAAFSDSCHRNKARKFGYESKLAPLRRRTELETLLGLKLSKIVPNASFKVLNVGEQSRGFSAAGSQASRCHFKAHLEFNKGINKSGPASAHELMNSNNLARTGGRRDVDVGMQIEPAWGSRIQVSASRGKRAAIGAGANLAGLAAGDGSNIRAGSGQSFQQLIFNNSLIQTQTSAPVRLSGIGEQETRRPRYFWLMLIGCILAPTFGSTILFISAYLRMKEFKVLLNKQPYSMPELPATENNSANSSARCSPFEESSKQLKEESASLLAESVMKVSSVTEDWLKRGAENQASVQATRQQANLMPPVDYTRRSVSQPSALPTNELVLRRAETPPRQRPASLFQGAARPLHQQLNQALSAPIGHDQVSRHQHRRQEPAQSNQPSSATAFLMPLNGSRSYQAAHQLRLSPSPLEIAPAAGATPQRDISFSAPPSATFRAAASSGEPLFCMTRHRASLDRGAQSALEADELAKQTAYEFRRFPLHARSFHYGSSSVRQAADQSAAGQFCAQIVEPIVPAKCHLSPGGAQQLERHRSLPHSYSRRLKPGADMALLIAPHNQPSSDPSERIIVHEALDSPPPPPLLSAEVEPPKEEELIKVSPTKRERSLPHAALISTYSHMIDDQLLKSNIIVFALNLILSLPFVLLSLALHYSENLNQEFKDAVWWLSTLNCCSCSYVYALTNKDFREAFSKLFYYCCCKSHVTFQKRTPVFRRHLELDAKGNLRLHIIPGLNVYSNKLTKEQPHIAPAPNHLLTNIPAINESQPSFEFYNQQTNLGAQMSQRHHLGAGFGGPLFGTSAPKQQQHHQFHDYKYRRSTATERIDEL